MNFKYSTMWLLGVLGNLSFLVFFIFIIIVNFDQIRTETWIILVPAILCILLNLVNYWLFCQQKINVFPWLFNFLERKRIEEEIKLNEVKKKLKSIS